MGNVEDSNRLSAAGRWPPLRLVVVSHKECWPCPLSPAGYATDGGFPFQMHALSELFDETVLVLPCSAKASRTGEVPITGHNITVVPLSHLTGSGGRRKMVFPFWLARNWRRITREVSRSSLVHAPIPSDVATAAMAVSIARRKPLFVRHCGNWFVQRTLAERFWKAFMERHAGGRNCMLATGGGAEPPSARNPHIRWIFSTTMSEAELDSNCTEPRRLLQGRLRLIIGCRQERAKGTGTVIRSLPLLVRDFPAVSLDVVGDGGSLHEFKGLASALGVGDRVAFHGRVSHDEVLRLLREADLFCYPTTASEGFPKVVHEALACALPVITTRVSVLPHMLESGCGVLIDEATPEALAEAVRTCVADQERYRRMSERGLATARQFTLEAWRDAIRSMLFAAGGPLSSHMESTREGRDDHAIQIGANAVEGGKEV